MDLTPIDDFRKSHQVNTKGALAAAIQLNRFFSADTLPIDASDYHTNKEGQVKGISKDNCQKILAEYGITRLLAAEGGRTSRGTMALMHDYAELINELRPTAEQFTEIEQYWVKRIRAFFTNHSNWNPTTRFPSMRLWNICCSRQRSDKRKIRALCTSVPFCNILSQRSSSSLPQK